MAISLDCHFSEIKAIIITVARCVVWPYCLIAIISEFEDMVPQSSYNINADVLSISTDLELETLGQSFIAMVTENSTANSTILKHQKRSV